MPRKVIPLIANVPYHIHARCINREWFRIPLPDVWNIFSSYLHFIRHAYGVRINSFVLMSNHFHLIATPTHDNLPAAMNYFMRETSRNISRDSCRINQVYGGPYRKCMLKSYHYFCHAYKYVYRNPVEAGLSNHVEEYPYSTLQGLLGLSKLFIPTEYDTILFGPDVKRAHSLESELKWMNTAYLGAHKSDIWRALKHPVFTLPTYPHGKPNPLEEEWS